VQLSTHRIWIKSPLQAARDQGAGMASQDAAIALSSDDEEGVDTATSGAPRLSWTGAEDALKKVPSLSSPSSSRPRAPLKGQFVAQKGKGPGQFINKCKLCIMSCNGITDSHMRWLDRFGVPTELSVIRKKYKLDILDIIAYVKSFQYTFFPCKKRKSNRNNSTTMLLSSFASNCCGKAIQSVMRERAMPNKSGGQDQNQSIDKPRESTEPSGRQRKDLCPWTSERHRCPVVDCLRRFWLDKFGQYIFIPLLVGRHFVAAAVAIKQRKIYFYDPGKDYGLRSATLMEKDILAPLQELTFDTTDENNPKIFHRGNVVCQSDVVPDLKIICEQALAIDNHCNPRPNPGEPDKRWRFQFVNEFLYQENDVDCGLFVCFFFECVARRIKLTVRKNTHLSRGTQLEEYRKWVAFSTCYGRMCRIADNVKVGKVQ
jgi:hypothetical protein